MIEIYVSPDGNDDAKGSSNEPLRTLHGTKAYVLALLHNHKEDIVIHLNAGTYPLTETLVLKPEDGGDGNFSITWQGSSTGKTEISGGISLTDWSRCGKEGELPEGLPDRVWFHELSKGTIVNTLYNEQGKIPRARGIAIKPELMRVSDSVPEFFGPDGPNRNLSQGSKEGETVWYHDRFSFPAGSIAPASDLYEAEFLIIPKHQWTMNILPLKKIDFENRIAYLQENCTYPIGVPHCAPEGSIWLENSLSVLKPGSWVFHQKSSRLYFCSESEEPPRDIEAACLTEFIRIEGEFEQGGKKQPVNGIHFKNIVFTHSNRFSFHGLTGKGVQHDWEMHDAPSCMVRLRHATKCSFSNCTFQEGSSGGLRMDLACRENLVENCKFQHLGGCAILLCGYGLSRNNLSIANKIINNHIHHIGETYWHSPAIFVWQSGLNQISSNYIHNTPYSAIVCSGRTVFDREGRGECSATIDWSAVDEQCGKNYEHNDWHYSGLPSWWMREPLMHARENVIEFNRIHDVMEVMGDGNGIYVSGAGGGNVVRFNAIGPCPSPTMAEAIRCDDDQHHTIIHGNLIFGQGGRATGITLKGINRVTNNILALPLNATFRGMLSLETGPLNGSVIKRNIFYTSATDQKFVSEIRIHGSGRKARLCDTDSDENIYFCTADPRVGENWIDNLKSCGVDNQSLACDPGFVNAEDGDFNLKENAKAHKIGFQPLPLEDMFHSAKWGGVQK